MRSPDIEKDATSPTVAKWPLIENLATSSVDGYPVTEPSLPHTLGD